MGLFRKMASVGTLGAVDFMSDKERAARSARLTKRYARRAAKEAKRQTELIREQTRLTQRQTAQPAVPAPPSDQPDTLTWKGFKEEYRRKRAALQQRHG